MKAILILLFILTCVSVFAVEYVDVVYKTNGDVLRGVIIENIPNDQIKLDINGNTITLKYNEIVKMAKEPVGQVKQKNSYTPSSEPKATAINYNFNKKYGIKLGLNSSSVKMDHDEFSDLSSLYGFTIGGFASFQTGSNMIIQPEILYSSKGFHNDYYEDYGEYEYTEKDDWRYSYIEIPVLFKYILPAGSVCFTPYVGPGLGISLGGKGKYDLEEYDYWEDEYYYDSGTDDLDDVLEDTEFSINLGSDIVFSDRFSAELRYNIGLTDAFKGEFGDYFHPKNRVLILGINYTF